MPDVSAPPASAAAAATDTACRQRWLSQGLTTLWHRVLAQTSRTGPDFDVVIVGSGYGGSVAAARLAGQRVRDAHGQERPLRIAVLERGREHLNGSFASSVAELPGQVRVGLQAHGTVVGNAEGLFDFRMGADVNALVANGLGGGSLINAGVLVPPDPTDPHLRLPKALLDDLLAHHVGPMREALGGGAPSRPNTLASRGPGVAPLRKTQALIGLAGGQAHYLAPISVAVKAGPNSAQVELPACNLCGDCMIGCNVGAKNSLDLNLLAQARLSHPQSVEVFTESSVLSLRALPVEGWELDVVHTDPALQARERGPLRLRAGKVILAAGSLGSTEILLRSRSDTLGFSARLGQGFSCNGDNIAAVHRMAAPAHCTDAESTPLDERDVGPTITGVVQLGGAGTDTPRVLVQEFAVPAPLQRAFGELVTTSQALRDVTSGDGSPHGTEAADARDPLAVDPRAMEHTLLVGLIGHDASDGALALPSVPGRADAALAQGVLRIDWPQARLSPDLNAAEAALQALVDQTPGLDGRDASLIPNPLWRLLPDALAQLADQPRGPVLTVHALGGCGLGPNIQEGVVNDIGQVYRPGATPDAVWPGLVVLDGAIVPGSLGANPALTIASLADRAMARLGPAWGLLPALPPEPRPVQARPRSAPLQRTRPAQPPTELSLVERLYGTITLVDADGQPREGVTEITLGYEPIPAEQLATRLGRAMQVNPSHPQSRLRVYERSTWDQQQLRTADDVQRGRHVAFEATLGGQMRFLHREPSSHWGRRWRSLVAFALNRAPRELYQRLRERKTAPSGPAQPGPLELLRLGWNMASHAGEVRRFDYELTLGEVRVPWAATTRMRAADWGAGAPLQGAKRFTYGRRASPWLQLTTLSLTRHPGLPEGRSAQLDLDLRFMAQQAIPLAQITSQANAPTALAELSAFVALFTRMTLSIHLWSFVKPDPPPPVEPVRMPGPIAGLPSPTVTELVLGPCPGSAQPVVARLTRYQNEAARTGQRRDPPLVMIHGYSVSGNTFTHPSLAPSAAQFFVERGRDVWVLDLRTSTALPTATLPWSFEDAGLIDIPAALVHVRNVTGQRVDVLAHCIGTAMLSMAMLTSAREVRSGAIELAVKTRLSEAQLGVLEDFNGASAGVRVHPTVRQIVLSQKGPLLRYTEANLFRGFVMQAVRRWILNGSYAFRPPQPATALGDAIDRLLSTLPYPEAEYDIENPRWPCAKTPWVASRHRMDALYARDFNADNMSAETLDATDDLFGPLHLDTVSQTIQFVRSNRITNQEGRGDFVTLRRLRDRWASVPTMAIHGALNGMVDPSTQELLQVNFEAAGVPFRNQPAYPGTGHQDLLIGYTAPQAFADIEDFLQRPPKAPTPTQTSPQTPACPAHVFGLPWIGPSLTWQHDAVPGSTLQLACRTSPDWGRGELVLVPVAPRPGGGWQRVGAARVTGAGGHRQTWLMHKAGLLLQDAPATATGWLAAIAYELGEATGEPGSTQAGQPCLRFPGDERDFPAGAAHPLLQHPPAALQAGAALDAQVSDWLEATHSVLDQAVVTLADLRVGLGLGLDPARAPSLRFALAAGQFPAGLLDRPVAQASLRALADDLDPFDFVLLAGNQICADATHGLADPWRQDERYEMPNEAALREDALRAIHRRRPVWTLLGDRELSRHWEPQAWAASSPEAATHDSDLRYGRRAFVHEQRFGAARTNPETTALDQVFQHGPAQFYLLDTRTRRGLRGVAHQDSAQLIDEAQWTALTAWLQQHRHGPKFIVSPARLLPMGRDTLDQPGDAARSDAWDGYPASVERLLHLLMDQGVTRTVFLSGDHPVGRLHEARVTRPVDGATTRLVGIQTPSLYAPLPFDNTPPTDLSARALVQIAGLEVVQTLEGCAGDGFADIGLRQDGTDWLLEVGFVTQAGRQNHRLRL